MNTRLALTLTAPLTLIVGGLSGCTGPQSQNSTLAHVETPSTDASPAAVRGDDHEKKMKAWASELERWEGKLEDWEGKLEDQEGKLEGRKNHLKEWQHELERWQGKLEEGGRHHEREMEHDRHAEEMFHGMEEALGEMWGQAEEAFHGQHEEINHRFEMLPHLRFVGPGVSPHASPGSHAAHYVSPHPLLLTLS